MIKINLLTIYLNKRWTNMLSRRV